MKPGLFSILACTIAMTAFLMTNLVGQEQDSPPNILLIVAEDMSDHVGVYGDALAQTPNSDRLATQGMRFTNVFTTAGVCAPSRAALMTGVYQTSMGAHQMRTSAGPIPYETVPPPDVKAFPELLRGGGYATANFAKKDYQFGEPFTIWDVNAGSFTAELEPALWRDLPSEKPFFAMVNLMWTHESRLFPADEEASGPFKELMENLAVQRETMIEHVTDPATVTVPPYYPDTPRVRRMIAQHYDNIHFMDSQVGEILRNLEEDGLADNTIVIWTTDHGDAFPRAKRAVYDSGIKVPMIVRFPDGRGAGTVETRMVSFVDMAPTLLTLAGVNVPDFIQGQDFLGDAYREFIFAARDRMDDVPDRVRAARDSRYKYIRNYRSELPYFRPLAFRDSLPIMQEWWSGNAEGVLNEQQGFYFESPRPIEELYDTQADPWETTNRAGDRAMNDILVRMRNAMDVWQAEVGDLGATPELEMIGTMWPGLTQPVTAAPQTNLDKESNGRQILSLNSQTEGASIGYRFLDDGQAGAWQLYTGPFVLPPGLTVESKAIRYGYAESETVQVKSNN